MPKQKQWLKGNKKKGKSMQTGPESADDYLQAGVDLEEAGEKWRAGDAGKSSRFFVKAIDKYDEGLNKFPRSFDLAYNKSRIQYDLSQQPRLIQQLPWTHIDLLQVALESHRYALALKQNDADTLFNTAQVLTSLAESLSESRSPLPVSREEALQLFQEALELFQRCLSVQELRFSEAQEQVSTMETDVPEESEETPQEGTSDAEEEEQWATIVEPITQAALLDTAIAQIETLTDICSLVASGGASQLSWIGDYAPVILEKVATYQDGQDRIEEVSLAKANFACAFADAQFRSGVLNLTTYEQEVEKAFVITQSPSPQALCDRADASLTLSASIYGSVQFAGLSHADISQLNDIRWKHLTRALTDLTAAAKIPGAENLPKIHLRRGDCEMLRYRLGETPTSYEISRKNAATLLKNAETYYRGSAKLAEIEGSEHEVIDARVKEAAVNSILGNGTMLLELAAKHKEEVQLIVEEMKEESLLSNGDLAQFGL